MNLDNQIDEIPTWAEHNVHQKIKRQLAELDNQINEVLSDVFYDGVLANYISTGFSKKYTKTIKDLVEKEVRKARIDELTKADTSDEYYFKRLAQLKGQINV